MRTGTIQTLLAAALLFGAPALAADAVRDRPVLTLDGAKTIIAAAEADAIKRGLKVSIAIVDPAGVPIMQLRMDDASMVGPEIALAKARTAAGFNNTTASMENRLQKEGALRLLSMPALLSEGGIPVKVGGKTVAAVGVSGATSQEDGLIAAAGAATVAK